MIGSKDSRIEAQNTVNTLKSYEAISQKRSRPVIMLYFENSTRTPRSMVDQRAQTVLVLLSVLFSGENKELDSADLGNFLNYPRVTSYDPRLALLDFFSGDINLEHEQSVISVVTLTDGDTAYTLDMPIEYQSVGYITEGAKKAITVELPIHASIISGFFPAVINILETRISEIDEARSVILDKPITHISDGHTDEGLLF